MNDKPLTPEVQCDCDGFTKSMDQIIGAQELAWIHGWRYTGDIFSFCPWCGKEFRKIPVIEESVYD